MEETNRCGVQRSRTAKKLVAVKDDAGRDEVRTVRNAVVIRSCYVAVFEAGIEALLYGIRARAGIEERLRLFCSS